MKYLLIGLQEELKRKQDYYKKELEPHEDYEYVPERYNQIKGIIEGLEYVIQLINEMLPDFK